MRARARLVGVLGALIIGSGIVAAAPVPGAAALILPVGFEQHDYVSIGQRLTTMAWAPDGRLFVSEKQGNVRVVRDGTLLSQPFLTVSTATESEKGLKGITFDPAFASNGFVYIYYTDPVTLKNRVSRFTTSATNPDRADPNSELVLVEGIGSGTFHSAGALHFGPDGKLYISTGDASYAPNSQNLHNLDGKILRLNPDGSVPSDNPFVGILNDRPEIWAYGLRNPFTFAFDTDTGRMFINDVGNATWEEIDEGVAGANYGWPTCEGVCSEPGMTNPLYTYNHADGPGKSITGAEFYSGTTFPVEYRGDYFFGDYVGNYIKRYDMQTGQVVDFATDTPNVADIRTGPDGALYYLSVEAKKIVRIQYTGASPPPSGDLVLEPIADDHVAASVPDRNYGRSPLLYASSGSDLNRVFLEWDLTALAGQHIASVALRIHTDTASLAGSTATQTVRHVDDDGWTELGLTYNNQPSVSATLGTLGPTQPDTEYLIPLDAAEVEGHLGGLFSVAVDSSSPVDTLFFYSRDSYAGASKKPALVITTSTTPPPPPVIGSPPEPQIDEPAFDATYRAGDEITYSGSASDAEDGALGPDSLTWEVVFHHDTHTHPFIEPFSGVSGGTFVVPDTGETSDNVWFRIHLTATDSDGNSVDTFRDIVPLKSQVTLATVPAGLSVLLDGSPKVTPTSFIGVEGLRRQLTAPATQTLAGHTYEFDSWSDGGAADHSIATPQADTTYTATYTEVTGGGASCGEGIAGSPDVGDTFGRSIGAGWGSADVGGSYTLSGGATSFSVAGGQGILNLAGSGANRAATLNGVSLRDAEILVCITPSKVAAGNATYVYAEARVVGTNAYRPKIILNADGSVAVHAGKVVNGKESSVAPPVVVAGLTQAAGKTYWLHALVSGDSPTTIKINTWADGEAEPAGWQFSATDSTSALQVAGGSWPARVHELEQHSDQHCLRRFQRRWQRWTGRPATPAARHGHRHGCLWADARERLG